MLYAQHPSPHSNKQQMLLDFTHQNMLGRSSSCFALAA